MNAHHELSGGATPTLFDRAHRHPVGFSEVTPRDVAAALGKENVRLVDVREPAEVVGELGHIAGAELVPLGSFELRARAWMPDEPVVLVCRSGARSGRAAATLVAMGFTRVMNMAGGMMAWNEARLPVVR